MNVYFQRESLGAAFRLIPTELKSLEQLGMPDSLNELAERPRGLVLVTGPTGSGKSTTLAAMIDLINSTRADHIMTIEDPIEFLHRHKRCIVNQREIGPDATSFAEALKGALRQDPDVILLGEMRDLETIGTALTAAETGHLVFATLHTQDAPSTVDRLIDVVPGLAQQEQIRVQIAGTLQGVVTQTLSRGRTAKAGSPRSRSSCRTTRCETSSARRRSSRSTAIMQTAGKRGMQTLEQSLADLVMRGIISQDVALNRSSRPEQLLGLLERAGVAVKPVNPDATVPSARFGRRGASRGEAGRRTEDRRVAARGRPRVGERLGRRCSRSPSTRSRPDSSSGRGARRRRASRSRSRTSSRSTSFPGRAVRVGIANNRIGVRTIDLAGIADPKQLANAVRFRAQEALPIPIDEAVARLPGPLRARERGGHARQEGPARRRLPRPRGRLRARVQARGPPARRHRPRGVRAPAGARPRRPAGRTSRSESALVAVAIGSERTILAVSDGFTCEFTRVVNWGGATLTAQLASALQLEAEQAEQVKTMLSLAEAPGAVQGSRRSRRLRRWRCFAAGFEGFARELVSSLQFYQSQPNSLGIREVDRRRRNGQLGGLAETLHDLIGVTVRVGDPGANVGVGRKAPVPGPGARRPDRSRNGGRLMVDMNKEIKLSDLFRR